MLGVAPPGNGKSTEAPMRRAMFSLLAALALAATLAAPVLAHDAGPCSGTARDYAAHHVVALAKDGLLGLGNGGHVPGDHRGYSLCLGVH